MIRIYPTTQWTYHNQNQTFHYHVVSFYEYLHDQNIDPFFIDQVIIVCQNDTVIFNKETLKHAYLGYLADPKVITLIFPKDSLGESWLFNITDVQLKYRSNIPNWGDEENV